MTHEARVAALAACSDISDLAPADRELLADRVAVLDVSSNHLVFAETTDEDEGEGESIEADDAAGLYVIAEGLISVERRSEQRRAPSQFLLAKGGLFGENFLGEGGMVSARALRPTRLLKLRASDFGWAENTLRSFGAITERLKVVHKKAPWVVECLRRSPVLRHVPPRLLFEILEGARIRDYHSDETILAAGEDPRGVLVILRGEVVLNEPASGHAVRLLSPGDVLGDIELLTSRGTAYQASAVDEVRLLWVSGAVIDNLMQRSSTFRRSVLNCSFGKPEQRQQLIERIARHEADMMNLVAFVGDDPRLPLTRLAAWAALATAKEFGDRVVLLLAERGGPAEPEFTTTRVGEGEVIQIRIDAQHPDLRNPTTRLAIALDCQYVFWALEGLPPNELPPEVASAERVVYVASRPYETLPPYVDSRLPRPLIYTAVVPSPGLPADTVPMVPYGNARIHRDLIAAAKAGKAFDELAPALAEQVGRWARAITRRSVGLALGGGGPFGYAHLPLIRAIEAARIPIDLIAGASIGSVLGAYYSSLGVDGLDKFFKEAAGYGKGLMPRVVWDSAIIAESVEKAIGPDPITGRPRRLEDLLRPFYPVAVDVDRACQVTVRHGSIAVGVRASCALPGPFAPIVMEEREPGREPRLVRLVDGGVINMVPDDTLYLEGANVVVASNVIPPPRARPPEARAGLLGRTLTRVLERLPVERRARLKELNPYLRGDDVIRTMFMMMHVPTDWHARTADAKFSARSGLYSPMSWDRGEDIMNLQDPGRLERTVDKLRQSYKAMAWQGLLRRPLPTSKAEAQARAPIPPRGPA